MPTQTLSSPNRRTRWDTAFFAVVPVAFAALASAETVFRPDDFEDVVASGG